MAKSRVKRNKKRLSEKIDLNYKKDIVIVQIDNEQIDLIKSQYDSLLKEMNKKIDDNMRHYNEAQNMIIERKLQNSAQGVNILSVDDLREQYANVLDMYERLARKNRQSNVQV